MRKRVPIVLGGGVALILASQFLDFGLGFRDGSGPGDAAQDAELAAVEEAIADIDSMPPIDAPATNLTDEPPAEMELVPAKPAAPPVVDILIDGNQYWIATDADDLDQREAKTLDEIIALAQNVSGEPNGIRVRIARTPDAIAASEAALLTRLGEAGMNKDEIDSRRQLVESRTSR
ncbi:hypothetical protein [Neorhodopirellula pilleata]|uniref:Biopolymer transport protein ExbD/TolR n=1 Tax=Neorhodopirellula pilleata TaxID=2714738 RepID=A0A5C6A7W1_9BACT|nr:hypothetical protein [Neorhodopirellula pilleata]TWT95609.1 hypothetical protein Pla100_32500 [Neorhodopirellula pilleata]